MRFLLAIACVVLAVPAIAQPSMRAGAAPNTPTQTPTAQTPTTQTPSPVAPSPSIGAVTMVDGNFLANLMADNQAVITMARLAVQRASDANVRQWAQELDRDHTQVAHDVQALGRAQGLQTVATTGQVQQQAVERLQVAESNTFDAAFLDQVQAAINRMQTEVDQERSLGRAPEIRRFADGIGPLIQANNSQIKNLRKRNRKHLKPD